jgi:regulation of enolase protein 1 (concanavalin A-like superfamily)
MFSHCTWLNEPAVHALDDAGLTVTTDGATDFWRITRYGFIRDSGHFLGRPVEGDFTAQVHVQGNFQQLYDQAGLMVRIDERRWIKAGVEFSDGALLLSTVLTDERSDWATSLAPALPDGFWLRVTVAAGAIRVQYSADGVTWPLLRLAPFPIASRYLVGPMCCTPERAGLTVRFEQFTLGPALVRDLHDLS